MFDDDATDPGSTALSNDCPDCGADMQWDPAAYALVCSYCGGSRKVESEQAPNADEAIADFEKAQETEAFLATSRRLRCKRCGATIDFQGAVASRCEFCGAHAVAEIHDHAQAARPSGIIPFGVGRDEVARSYAEWGEAEPLLPREVREGLPLEDLSGVYLPFWVFDVRVDSQCRARCGFVTVDAEGNSYTRWESRGKVADNYRSGLGVYASVGLPQSLVDQLVPWYAESAHAWDEAFLSGFPAEAPQISPTQAWEHAKEQIRRLEFQAMHGAFGADVVKDVKLTCTFAASRAQLIYMPVWVAAYRFRGRVFRFLVNGRTGEVAGQAPLDRRQLAVGLALIVILLFLFVIPGLCALFDLDCYVGEPDIPEPTPIQLE